MTLEDWRERLLCAFADAAQDAGGQPLIRDVLGAATLGKIAGQPETLAANAAFVAPGQQASPQDPNVMECQVLVVLALRDQTDRLGGDRQTDLERAIDTVRKSLHGWTPPGAAAPARFTRSAMIDLSPRSIWCQMEFAVAELLPDW